MSGRERLGLPDHLFIQAMQADADWLEYRIGVDDECEDGLVGKAEREIGSSKASLSVFAASDVNRFLGDRARRYCDVKQLFSTETVIQGWEDSKDHLFRGAKILLMVWLLFLILFGNFFVFDGEGNANLTKLFIGFLFSLTLTAVPLVLLSRLWLLRLAGKSNASKQTELGLFVGLLWGIVDSVRWVSQRFSRRPIEKESELWDRIHSFVLRQKDFATSVLGFWVNLFVAVSSLLVLSGLWMYLKTEDVTYAMPGSLDDIEDRAAYVDFFGGPIEAYTDIEKPSLRAIQWASRETHWAVRTGTSFTAMENGQPVPSQYSNGHRKAWSRFLLACFTAWVVLPRWLSLVLFGISARGSSEDPMPTRDEVRTLLKLARQESSVLPISDSSADEAKSEVPDAEFATTSLPPIEVSTASGFHQETPTEQQDEVSSVPSAIRLDVPIEVEQPDSGSESVADDHSLAAGEGSSDSPVVTQKLIYRPTENATSQASVPETVAAEPPTAPLHNPLSLAEKLKGAIESAKQRVPTKIVEDVVSLQPIVLAGYQLSDDAYGWVEKLAARLRSASCSLNILSLDDEDGFLQSVQPSDQVVLVTSLVNTADDDYREFLGEIGKVANPTVIITDGAKQLLTASSTADRTTALRGWKQMTARGGVPTSSLHIHDLCNQEGSETIAKLLQGKSPRSSGRQLSLVGRYKTAARCISEAVEAKDVPQVEVIDQLSESLANLYSPERESVLAKIRKASGIKRLPNATKVREIVDNVANFDPSTMSSLSLAKAVKGVIGTWLSGIPKGWAVAGGIAGVGAVTVAGVAALAVSSPAAIAILPGLVWGSPIAGLTGAAVSASAKRWLIGCRSTNSGNSSDRTSPDSDPATSMIVAKTGILQTLIYELRGNPDTRIQATISDVTSELDQLNISDELLLVKTYIEKMRSLEAKS